MSVTQNSIPRETLEGKLAIAGGTKVREAPFPVRHLFGEEEKQAVVALFDDAIRNGHTALGYNGPQEEAYCKEFAQFMGGGFADGVNSGTNAVYIALRALEIEPFTEVIVPPITDPGGVMPVVLNNCIPVPADCAMNSFNVGADQIAERINERTSAIIVAHIAGSPCNMQEIMSLAKSHGIPVIEDCAQAHGAVFKGKKVGAWGDVASFSTMFGKHHATGGQGGVVYTRNEEIYWKIRRYADRGKPFGVDPEASDVVSLNCNMDELHAAIGRVQLGKLPEIIRRRRSITDKISEKIRRSDLKAVHLVEENSDTQSVYWFWLLHINTDLLRVGKAEFANALTAEGIPAMASYRPMPTRSDWFRQRKVFGSSGYPWASPLYKGDGRAEYELSNAIATDACHFRVSFHEDWRDQEIDDLVRALVKVESAYSKS